MMTKNAAPITREEREHLELVKAVLCGWCDDNGGFAHHTKQGNHMTTVGTCWECHQGPQGWHGDKRRMLIFKRDENDALNLTLKRVAVLKRRWENAVLPCDRT